MHLLGHNLPDHKPLRIALTSFYGLSHSLAPRLLARLRIPNEIRVADLTESQITSLSAYLSSPSTTPRPAPTPLSAPTSSLASSSSSSSFSTPSVRRSAASDPRGAILDELKIETDLRRSMQADIAHQRQVGTYRGRRHALRLPVRGQKTRNNAHTAKALNKIERRNYSSSARSISATILDLTAGAFRR